MLQVCNILLQVAVTFCYKAVTFCYKYLYHFVTEKNPEKKGGNKIKYDIYNRK